MVNLSSLNMLKMHFWSNIQKIIWCGSKTNVGSKQQINLGSFSLKKILHLECKTFVKNKNTLSNLAILHGICKQSCIVNVCQVSFIAIFLKSKCNRKIKFLFRNLIQHQIFLICLKISYCTWFRRN